MENQKAVKKPTLLIALIPIIFLIVVLSVAVIGFGQDPHIPVVLGAVVAAFIGVYLGHSWKELEGYIIDTITLSMQASLILMIIGMLTGTWIMSGTVPAMIYYGLKIISPGAYLAITCFVCSVVSLATGSSWTTAGTVGVALIGVGQGLGIPIALCAGAVVSGAYFGDKMSPLSDTTNLAPAMAGTTLFEHIGHMIFTTGPAWLISLVLYAIIGMGYSGSELDQGQINIILEALHADFNINIFLFIPPIAVIAMVVLKTPAIPGLMAGTFLGGLFYFLFQGGFADPAGSFANILDVINYGYVSESGIEMVDELLTRGGMQSMMWTISLILCAMAFGGIMERIGCLETIAMSLLGFAKSTGSMILCTLLTSIFINIVAADQYLSIVVPGRMYKDEFRRRGLHPKNLSRCLEDAGTVTSALVPWNTCGAFMAGALGVGPLVYLPYAFLNLLSPCISAIYGFTGITIAKLPEEEMAKVRAEAEATANS